MSTSPEFMEYVNEQFSDAGDVSHKKMFGEYGLYMDGKFVGLVCDDEVFIKITNAGRNKLREVVEKPPYDGASPYFLISELDDPEYIRDFMQATWAELPFPKPKKKKAK